MFTFIPKKTIKPRCLAGATELYRFGKEKDMKRNDQNYSQGTGYPQQNGYGQGGIMIHAQIQNKLGKQQSKKYAESHRCDSGRGNAAEGSDGDAGKCGMTQCIGEEAHPSGDDHGGHETEQRCHQ